jgi:putative DNA primase/helicase
VLTLQGEQNLGKTYWLKSLVTPPMLCDSVVCEDHLLDPESKDNVLTVVTHWLVELGELESTFRRDMGRIKGFLTSSCDVVRRPYARLESSFARRTVFFASVNSDTFLTDPTGDSRFWTLPVTRVDYDHGIDMQQVWKQVTELYLAGEQWWLTPEESDDLKALNEQFLVPSTIEDMVRHRYDEGTDKTKWVEKTPLSALQELGFHTPTDSQRMAAGRALTKIFGKPRYSNGKKLYLMPPLKTFQL